MKPVHDRTIPIIFQVERIYWLIWCLKSVLGTPTFTRSKYKADLAAESAFSLPPTLLWLGTHKNMSLLAKKNKKTVSYHHPNQGMFQLHIL